MDLRIDLDLSPALRALDDLKTKQIPFATALALTKTAQAAQREIKRQLPQRFKIRNAFVERGVRIEAATKASQQAAVFWKGPAGSQFGLSLVRQEVGSPKRPYSRLVKSNPKLDGRAYLALPRGVKRGARGIIPRAQRPAAVLNRKNVFVKQDAGRGAMILQRGAKGAAPRLLYYLQARAAQIKPRFGFQETAQATVRRVWRREFGKAFSRAIATRRP